MQILDKIVWKKFMARHDLVFNEIPHIWYEAPFLGNGFMGATLCFSEDNRIMYINLGHTCVYDNRPVNSLEDDQIYLTPRLPIGKIAVEFKGTVTGVELRLDIFNARVYGTVNTTCGRVTIDCMIFNSTDCLLFEHTEKAGEKLRFRYIPSKAESPRYNAGVIDNKEAYNNYGRAKLPSILAKKNTYVFAQPYYCGGGFCISHTQTDGKLFVCADYDDDDFEALIPAGLCHLTESVRGSEEYINEHINWWNSYFKKSFISIDNGVYESFVYIQLYKLACASREDGRPFDTCGPWLSDTTRWPGCWWNLNVELSISPLYTSNHIDIAHCVNNTFKENFQQLIDNVPEEYRADCAALGRDTTSSLYAPVTTPGNMNAKNWHREAGNLTWTLYYLYQEYRITGDESVVRELVYPLLKRAVKYYSYFLYTDESEDKKEGRKSKDSAKDNTLHLKSTISPEYMKSDSPDVNYDLSLLRWGCKTLKEIVVTLGITDDDFILWEKILNNLTDYPKSDKEGLYIAAETPYAESHRHYSHLLMFYPLHLLSENKKKDRELVEKSILFWQSKPEALLGYSQSGAASMYAMLGDGNTALRHLENLWKGFITPNTMYHEGGNPVIETPPSAATAILEMLVQSHNGYIDFFPALPDEWMNICFDGLLCQDGFEVGAKLNNAKVEWIKITSKLGRKCKVRVDFDEEPKYSNTEYKILSDGKYSIEIEKGQTVILSTVPSPSANTVITPINTSNCYGLNSKNKIISGK